MNFETFIAKRYLISKHKINFITIISFISVAGITIGVSALIVVLSVFNGFSSLVVDYLMNLDPDIRITAISNEGEKDIANLNQFLSEQKEIKSFSPYIEGKVLAYSKGITQVVNLKGIDEESINDVYLLGENLVDGTDDNFTSIVNAIEEGRNIYSNIKKFVTYLLSSNLGEVFTIFTAIMIGTLADFAWATASTV